MPMQHTKYSDLNKHYLINKIAGALNSDLAKVKAE
jgi:hypothetical protein